MQAKYPRLDSNGLPLVADAKDTCGDPPKPRGAKSGALEVLSDNDADLTTILKEWPSLSESYRKAVMAIIKAGNS